MPFYLYKCSDCNKDELIKRSLEEPEKPIFCRSCNKQMERNYRGERAGPVPPFQAYWTDTLVDRDQPVYVKDKEQEKRLLKEANAVRTK